MQRRTRRSSLRATPRRTLADALRGADVFVGLSQAGLRHAGDGEVHGARIPSSSRWRTPIPRSRRDDVAPVRDDAIMATGRSDYPNQVNNVLGFPFIFRGALDVRARKINEPMKLAAVHALAELARAAKACRTAVRARLPARELRLRARVHHPEAVRSARPALRRVPPWPRRRWTSGVARRKIDVVEYAKRLEQTVGVLANL